MNRTPRRAALAIAFLLAATAPAAYAAAPVPAPVLTSPSGFAAMQAEKDRHPLFAQEVERVRKAVDAAMRAGINVPVPKDPGGGLTHEQHKRNYKAINGAGMLYRITGEAAYRDYARDMLLAYAALYPKLGKHPAASNQVPGRLFWQSLNDSVWLVNAVQGYDAIRGDLNARDRKAIDDKVFRRMAHFLSAESPEVFNRIHNHATWANAGVGMTGYVIGDRDLVEKALLGLDKSGKAGFLRQLDLLFSPDGYYAEGPYYQRYALMPFVIFAQAVQANDPERKMFEYRDGVVLKAVRAAIQLTYDGYFFPLNDAMPDKSLRTEELYQAVAIAYGQTRDPSFLSIAAGQGQTILSPEGLAVARDLAAGLAKPFPFGSALFRDGPNGDEGAVAVLRSGGGATDQALVAKNSAQGMGHGHFDKLSWLFYDNGNPIVTDYGAARFLNIEAKDGGRYLPENETWAKQTIAHNTVVVDETSHFGGKLKEAEKLAPRQLYFGGVEGLQASTAEIDGAYPGVKLRRTLAQVRLADGGAPVVLDLVRAEGKAPAQFDLPLHFSGHIIEVGFPLKSNIAERPVLGKKAGYQHLWVDAVGTPDASNGFVTWINDGRFYTYRMLPAVGSEVIIAESGANDPRFNLRREPVLIQRTKGADATFVSLLEPHGEYDASAETTVGSRTGIAALRRHRIGAAELIEIALKSGRTIVVAVADDVAASTDHEAVLGGKTYRWTGHLARFEGGRS